jgi:hypothetical protein
VRWLHGLIALLSKPLVVWAEDIVAMWALAVLAPVIARFVAGMGGYVVWCDVGTNGFLLLQQLFVTTMAAGGIGVLDNDWLVGNEHDGKKNFNFSFMLLHLLGNARKSDRLYSSITC